MANLQFRKREWPTRSNAPATRAYNFSGVPRQPTKSEQLAELARLEEVVEASRSRSKGADARPIEQQVWVGEVATSAMADSISASPPAMDGTPSISAVAERPAESAQMRLGERVLIGAGM